MNASNVLRKILKDSFSDKLKLDIDRFFQEVGNDYILRDSNRTSLIRNVRVIVELTFVRYCEETPAIAPAVSRSQINELPSTESTNEKVSSAGSQTETTSDDNIQYPKSNESNSIEKSSEDEARLLENRAYIGSMRPEVRSTSPVESAPSSETSNSQGEQVVHTHRTKTRQSTKKVERKLSMESDGSDDVERNSQESTPKAIHQCGECEYSSPSAVRLKRHINKHTNVRSFKCDHCPKAYKLKQGLIRHMESGKCKKPQQNEYSHFCVTDENSLEVCEREEHKEEYVCRTCKKSNIVGKTEFIKHIKCHIPNIKLSDDEIIAEHNSIKNE